MKNLTLLLLLASLLPTFSASGLTLDEAVAAAVDNHQRIEQSRADVDQSRAAVGSARAGFYPNIDLSYGYINRDQDPHLLGEGSSTLTLSGSLNLFNGLSDYHSYRAARQRADAADYQLQGTVADIILEAKLTYIQVLRAERSVATAREGVELLNRQQGDAQLQFDYGLIARNDLLRVEVELSNARQELLQTEGQLQIARRQLERTIGIELPESEKLDEQGFAQLPELDPQLSRTYRQELLNNRSELYYLRSQLKATKLDRTVSRGSYLPDLDLTLSHEEYGEDLSFGTEDNDNLLTLRANWNLFDGFAKNQAVAAADSRIRAVVAELRDTEAALVLQLETALQNARIARGRLDESGVGVTQAEENYRVSENRYQQQQATTVDLLDAQFLLTRARNLEVDARYDLYLSAAQLERILERGKKQR